MKHRPITLIVLLSAVVVSAQSPRVSSVCFSTDADGDEIITITGDAPLRFDFSKTVSPRTFVLDLIGA
ncbi:hypothetical protein KAU45_02025, partial [bacterium]|nr:hypothetical protein [bacterium]